MGVQGHQPAPGDTMRHVFPTLLAAAVAAAFPFGCPGLHAQGVSTTAIQGSVRSVDGDELDADVVVRNTATGFSTKAPARKGRFLVLGLEVGGPYVVTVRRLGFRSQERAGLFLTLGEPIELRFLLEPGAIPQDTLRVVAPIEAAYSHGGVAMTIPDSLLHRLPSLNRDFYDFVRLVPQISTKVGPVPGLSGGGIGIRFNNFLIDGVSERTVASHGTLALLAGKSLPLDAVKEYQVLIAPYDARYSDFAGALVNTVTKSGTNELEGSVFAYARSDELARAGEFASPVPYEQLQYGFSVGGPVVRDRLHYFVATELQHLTSPAEGPYLGQPASATPPVPVTAAAVSRLDDILRSYGLTAGTGGFVQNGNPLKNVFARFDLAIPAWNSRAVVWSSYSGNLVSSFSRLAPDTFSLSTYQREQASHRYLTSFQLHTSLPRIGGGHNELLASYRSVDGRIPVRCSPADREGPGSVHDRWGGNAQHGNPRGALKERSMRIGPSGFRITSPFLWDLLMR